MQGSKTFYSSVVVSVAGGMGNATDYRLDGGDHNDYMTNVNLPFPFPDAVNQFSAWKRQRWAHRAVSTREAWSMLSPGQDRTSGMGRRLSSSATTTSTQPTSFPPQRTRSTKTSTGAPLEAGLSPINCFSSADISVSKRDQSQSLTQAFVPTPANLLGDFSVTDGASCQASGKAIQLLNPQTGAPLPNDQISPSYFSAPSIALEKYLPATTDRVRPGVLFDPFPAGGE